MQDHDLKNHLAGGACEGIRHPRIFYLSPYERKGRSSTLITQSRMDSATRRGKRFISTCSLWPTGRRAGMTTPGSIPSIRELQSAPATTGCARSLSKSNGLRNKYDLPGGYPWKITARFWFSGQKKRSPPKKITCSRLPNRRGGAIIRGKTDRKRSKTKSVG